MVAFVRNWPMPERGQALGSQEIARNGVIANVGGLRERELTLELEPHGEGALGQTRALAGSLPSFQAQESVESFCRNARRASHKLHGQEQPTTKDDIEPHGEGALGNARAVIANP